MRNVLICLGSAGQPSPQTTILVKHSQSRNSSSCPPSFLEMYNGYSFVFLYSYAFSGGTGLTLLETSSCVMTIFCLLSAGVDLGGTGSCLKVFAPLPFVSCTRETCDSDDRTGYRYEELGIYQNRSAVNP